jgi:hypothetical protein
VTPAQHYATRLRTWQINRDFDWDAYWALKSGPRRRRGAETGSGTDWPWTTYERAPMAAYGRLGRWR